MRANSSTGPWARLHVRHWDRSSDPSPAPSPRVTYLQRSIHLHGRARCPTRRLPRSWAVFSSNQRGFLAAARSVLGRWASRLGLELLQMGHQLLQGGPSLEVQADHLEGPQRPLTTGPEVDQ